MPVIEDPGEKVDWLNKLKKQIQQPWWVILHNDNYNGMIYVAKCLVGIIGFSWREACEKMLEAHTKGLSHLATFSEEEAELRAEQLHNCNLTATIEPAE